MRHLHFQITRPPASVAGIDAFEMEIGVPLPDDYREFLLTYNGGCMRMAHSFYPVPERFYEFREEYKVPGVEELGIGIEEMFGLLPLSDRFSLGGASQLPAVREFQVPGEWLPVSSDGCGNIIFLWREGQEWRGLRFWDNGTGESFPIADSCNELYERLTKPDYSA